MEAETQRERLRSLTEQAQQMVEQAHRLAQRADALAARWHATQRDPQAATLPRPVDYDAVHLATELETLNTELSGQLEMERTLALAERTRLAAILEAMGDAVLVVDAAGTPLLTNRAYQEFLGPEPVTFEAENGEALLESATPRWRAARGESFTHSCVVHRAAGQRRWCEATGRPAIVGRIGLARLGQLDAAQLHPDDLPVLRQRCDERQPRQPAAQAAGDQDDRFARPYNLV